MDVIQVHNAWEHNLKHIDVTIPRNKLVVFTGVSGSGKSSLAFDTLFAEGQRRYLDSLSTYARQYLEQLEKPNVDFIDGLSPAISIDQKTASRNPRSTVGTNTEILDYLRLLFAKVGTPYCPECGEAIQNQSIQRLIHHILAFPTGKRLQLLAPIVRGRKGDYNALFQRLRKEGYSRVQIDGETHLLEDLSDDYRLAKTKTHSIAVVIDRLVIPEDNPTSLIARITQSLETCFKKADGFMELEDIDETDEKKRKRLFSLKLACGNCDLGFEELAPRLFSFNSPYGACPDCDGLGIRYDLSEVLLVPDPSKSLAEGTIAPFQKLVGKYYKGFIQGLRKRWAIPIDEPFESLTNKQQHFLLYGSGKPLDDSVNYDDDDDDALWADLASHFDGIIPILQRRLENVTSAQKDYLRQFMIEAICTSCQGKRLKPLSLSVKLGDASIYEWGELSLAQAMTKAEQLSPYLDDTALMIAREPIKEVVSRLRFLIDVGLDYLTLNRRTATLSGGEAQRIRLAAQIGSQLSGVLYVLDEPSIGLHPHNNQQLINTLKHLRDLGNSLIVVEHDEDTIKAADWIVDIGPLAGRHGGHIVASSPVNELLDNTQSLTAQYLTKHHHIPLPDKQRRPSKDNITLHQATLHNLKDITVSFPLGQFICVTGMSGSGKSTLIFDLLYPLLQYQFGKHHTKPLGCKSISGLEHIDKFIHIDQSPIGRSPRSNPATYTGLFDHIRPWFANSEEAKVRGFTPSHFSFNVKVGQCPTCKGDGCTKIEMNFLPDVFTPCPSCRGKRYHPKVLDVKVRGKTIADVLALTVEEALEFMGDLRNMQNTLHVLNDVGLGYIQLGQSATTLSGGEAQRLKLATEFCRKATGKTLYLMDEPTIGLHWHDLSHLLGLINRLVDAGNTVIVIEHNLELIKTADTIIDMGPMGGQDGGEIVAVGSPKAIANNPNSLTGQYLKAYL